MRISILSISCCNPAMRSEDQDYLAKVRDVLTTAKLEAQVKVVTISEATAALGVETVGKLRHQFERFGPAMLPAMVIDDELVRYGGVPTTEKILEVITKYGTGHGVAGSGIKVGTSVNTKVRP